MRSRALCRFRILAPAIVGLCLLLPAPAFAEYYRASLFYPIMTPTCPEYVRGFFATSLTGATGVDEFYVSTVTVQINLSGPGYTVTTSPPVMSMTVNSNVNTVDWFYERDPAEHGGHLLTATHTWIVGVVPILTAYTNAFLFVDH